MAAGLDGHPGLVTEPILAVSGHRSGVRPQVVHEWPGQPARGATRLAAMAAVILLGSAALAGCAGQDQSGPPAARVSTWVTGAEGGTAIGTLEVDSRNVDLALTHHQSAAAIREVCALLTNDAQTAIGNLPTPDTQLTNDLNAAYEDAAAAGDDCYKGSTGNTSLLRRSASERVQLFPLLAAAVDRITSVTGRTPSTSTTLPSGADNDPFGN